MDKDNYGLKIVFPSGMFESSITSITMPFESPMVVYIYFSMLEKRKHCRRATQELSVTQLN